jgi:hypothetical protein
VEALVDDLEYDVLKAHYVPQLPQYMPAGVVGEGEEEAAAAAAAAAAEGKGDAPALEAAPAAEAAA